MTYIQWYDRWILFINGPYMFNFHLSIFSVHYFFTPPPPPPAERRGDMVKVGEVPSVCRSVRHTLLCATPPIVLMRFEPNFHRMIVTKFRSAYRHFFFFFLRFHYLSWSYCSLFKFTLCATTPTVLMRFEPNFHSMIVTKCRSAYYQYFAIPLFIKELV